MFLDYEFYIGFLKKQFYTHTHTHTHIYIYIYVCVCVCVCVCEYIYVLYFFYQDWWSIEMDSVHEIPLISTFW